MTVYEKISLLRNRWKKEKARLFLIGVMIILIELMYDYCYKEIEQISLGTGHGRIVIQEEDIVIREMSAPKVPIGEMVEENQEEEIEHDYNWYMNTSYMSLKDVDLLARIINAEAGNQEERTKELVGIVVMNRVKSDKYPDTIYRVIYQRLGGICQFSPVENGSIDDVPSEESYLVAKRVLEGDVEWVEGLIAFESISEGNVHSDWADVCMKEGAITFYRSK